MILSKTTSLAAIKAIKENLTNKLQSRMCWPSPKPDNMVLIIASVHSTKCKCGLVTSF